MIRRLAARSGTPRYVVILCHGLGSNADDLIALAPHWAAFAPDATFVSPDAPEDYDMAPGQGRQWFSLAERLPTLVEAGARRAAPWLNALIDAELEQLNLPKEACAIMGFSQGAMMALFAGIRRTPPPAGILAYSGGLVAPERAAAERSGTPPILIVHGRADPVVECTWSETSAATLKAAGLDVQTLFIPGLGHGIDEAGMLAGAQFLRRVLA